MKLAILVLAASAALAASSAIGRRRHESIHHEDPVRGLFHHLDYDLELGESTVVLKELSGLRKVSCSNVGRMAIHFQDAASCQSALPHIVKGARLIGDTELKGHCGSLVHRPDAAGFMDEVLTSKAECRHDKGAAIHVTTRKSHLHHVFKNARVRLSTNHHAHPDLAAAMKVPEGAVLLPAGSSATFPVESPFTATPKKLKRNVGSGGFFSSLVSGFKSAINAIAQIPDIVESAIDTVVVVAKVLITGQYTYSNTWNMATWGFERPFLFTKTENGPGLTLLANPDALDTSTTTDPDTTGGGHASGSFAVNINGTASVQAATNLNFKLDIENYALQSLEASIDGKLTAGASLQGTVDAEIEYESAMYTLGTFPLPDISFVIGGLPFVVHSTVPVNASFHFTAEASAEVLLHGELTGSATFGIQYDPTNDFKFVHDFQLTKDGGLDGVAAAQATLKINIMPTLVIVIDYIGGPSIGLNLSPEATLAVSNAQLCPPTEPNSNIYLTATANLGFVTTIAADIDIELGGQTLFQKELGPFTVWQIKKPLYFNCVQFSVGGDDQLALPSPARSSAVPILKRLGSPAQAKPRSVLETAAALRNGKWRHSAAGASKKKASFVPRAVNGTFFPFYGVANSVAASRPLRNATISSSVASRLMDAPDAFIFGSTWSGQQVRESNDPSCTEQFPAVLDIFVQSIPSEDNTESTALISFSGYFSDQLGQCMAQVQYSIESEGNGVYNFTPIQGENNQAWAMGFYQCAYTGSQALNPIASEFQMSADFNTLTAFGGSECINTVLTRNN